MRHRPFVAAVVALCCTIPSIVAVRPAGAAPPPPYLPPVEVPVVDPFRPPAGPYGAGNRGLEYGSAPGTEVHAAADGVVAFAGVVAGTRHVTVRHPDGVRTSYSFLDRVDVVVGQHLRQGDVVGTTTGHLHFGARVGDAYLDPASLLVGGAPQVELVPFDEPPGEGEAGERSAIRQLIGGIGGAVGAVGDLTGAAFDHLLAGTGATAAWLREEGDQLLWTAVHYSERITGLAQLRAALRIWQAARSSSRRPCTAADVAPSPRPPGRRVALLVAGLGSTSDSAAIDDLDTTTLGYATPDVVRFSYEGGRTPDPTDGLPRIDAVAYGAAASQIDLREAGRRLADLVEAVVEAVPAAPLDLYAHSQGGLVTRLALLELERRHGAAWLDRIGLVATLGTPHGGADLATAIYAVGSTQVGSAVLDGTAAVAGLELDDDAPSAAQLAETSDVVRELAEAPLPAGVDAISIAARGDLVVPVPRTRAPGATQVVVPVVGLHAHDALPGSPQATRELALALAGQPPTCTSFRAALADQLVGEGISWAEDTAGLLGWYGGVRVGPPLGG